MGKLKRKNSFKKTQNAQAARFQNIIARQCATKYLSETLQQQVREETEKRLDNVTSIYYLCYFSLALHRQLGFGQTRIKRMLQALTELDDVLCEASIDELVSITEKECGVIISAASE